MKKSNLFSKILAKVKFEIIYDEKGNIEFYQVKKKNFYGEWVNVVTTKRLQKAIHVKHNTWLYEINQFGKTSFLFERRRKREKQRIQRLSKK